MSEQRRLAAILVADVVGYSKLVGSDETGTLAKLSALKHELIEPTIAKHSGRLFKAMGDGFLVEFASAVQAVTAAQAIQQANTSGNMQLRIGLHVGDVVVQGDDLLGDGVNIAARIERIAEPGSIAISRAVHEQVRGKVIGAFIDKGEITLKNIEQPVHVFSISGATPIAAAPALPLPDKPSIAVLPFQNMSGDPEQEYFVDGLVEDIITALSRFRSLFVIARNSSFAYKGKSPDIRQVGRELGVRYVLEGSVRKAGNRVRITGQLIEAESGSHLWADNFDGALEDVFDLQDKVALAVAGAIEPALLTAEIRHSLSRPTGDLTAYDLYLRSIPLWLTGSTEDLQRALLLLQQAIDRDPGFAMALAVAGEIQSMLADRLGPEQRKAGTQAAFELLRRALATGTDDPAVLAEVGGVLGFKGEIATARPLISKSLVANPGSAFAWQWSGWLNVCLGESEQALRDFDKAWRLSPRDPFDTVLAIGRGMALFQCRRFAEASEQLIVGIERDPQFPYGYAILAASQAYLGDPAAGARTLDRLGATVPHYDPRDLDYLRKPEHLALVLAGLDLIQGSTS